jgi:hypothetical protein
MAVTVGWAVAAIATVFHGFPADVWSQAALAGAAIYLIGLALLRSLSPVAR